MKTRKKIVKNNDNIQATCFMIENLAKAFSRTGNFTVSDELYEHAKNIKEDSQGMLDAYDKETSDMFNATQAQIGKTLKACAGPTE